MLNETAWVVMASFVGAALLTGLVRKLALAKGILDVPNERSSHTVTTARGGGLAIVVTTLLTWLVLLLTRQLDFALWAALCGGGIAVAIVGFIDDRRPLPTSVRLAVHFGAALWALQSLGGMALLGIGTHTVALGWSGYLLGALAIVWVLNLFNFMDGIDGIAGSEAVFIAVAGAWLTSTGGGHGPQVPSASVVFGAACGGFLLWNWPPARIFMGDVGSGYLGYVIAVLALAAGRGNSAALWVWLILGGVFFVDATITLARRTLRGDRVYEAHRSHAYQWLARRFKSHKSVTVATIALNVLWLLPCAWFAARHPPLAAWTVLVALVPVTLVTFVAGAGRRENG